MEEWRRREEKEERERRREKRRVGGGDARVEQLARGSEKEGKGKMDVVVGTGSGTGARLAERRVRRRESKGALRSVVLASAHGPDGREGGNDVLMEDEGADGDGVADVGEGQRRSVRFAAQVSEVG